MSERLGHVAITDHNPRRGEKLEFSPAEAVRYRQRSSTERVNSHLHDNHGGRHVRVRTARGQSSRSPFLRAVGDRRGAIAQAAGLT